MATYEKPEQVLQAWLDGINNADFSGVLSLYSDDAVLLPTFSKKRLATAADRAAYFERLGGIRSLSVELHKRTLVVQGIVEGIHTLSGIYCWRLEDEGEMLSFEARFTFTLNLARPQPILHHHSSQIPRTL